MGGSSLEDIPPQAIAYLTKGLHFLSMVSKSTFESMQGEMNLPDSVSVASKFGEFGIKIGLLSTGSVFSGVLCGLFL